MSTIAIRLKWEIHRAEDRVLKANVDRWRLDERKEAQTEFRNACAVAAGLRHAHASEVVEGKGLSVLQEMIDIADGSTEIVERLKEIQARIVSGRRLPQTGETRRGNNEAMNDAFVKAYNPNVDPPFFVEWPKGNELGSGGWYCEESILAFWPDVVSDEPTNR